VEYSRLETLPQAVVYGLESPATGRVELLALVISGNQPLGISLNASGTYANLRKLEKAGLKADFITMVESISAISYDPDNMKPEIN